MNPKTKKTIIGIAASASLLGLGFYIYKKYKELTPEYTLAQITKHEKLKFKLLYPSLRKTRTLIISLSGLFKNNQIPNEDKAKLTQILTGELEKFKETVDLITTEALKQSKLQGKEMNHSREIWLKKDTALKAVVEKHNLFLNHALNGKIMVDNDIKTEITPQKLKELFHESIETNCNAMLDTAESFIKEKLETKADWKVEDLKKILAQILKGLNTTIMDNVNKIEGIKDKDAHPMMLYDNTFYHLISTNFEGGQLFIAQCEHVKKIVYSTLTEFRPDLTIIKNLRKLLNTKEKAKRDRTEEALL